MFHHYYVYCCFLNMRVENMMRILILYEEGFHRSITYISIYPYGYTESIDSFLQYFGSICL